MLGILGYILGTRLFALERLEQHAAQPALGPLGGRIGAVDPASCCFGVIGWREVQGPCQDQPGINLILEKRIELRAESVVRVDVPEDGHRDRPLLPECRTGSE